MPIVIGAKPESPFSDPIGLLADCHRRIERFLSVLVELGARVHGGSLTAAERTSLETALQYFREAAPKHTADEEDSLFPRLRASDRPGVKSVLARVEELERDHARADSAHAEIDRLGRAWLDSGSLADSDAARFSELAAGLAGLYRDHITLEEREVFPAASDALAAPDRQAIGREMAARRGLRQA